MNSEITFVIKVFIASLILSVAIKYGGPYLNIPATSINALIAVLMPTVLLGVALCWRYWQQNQLAASKK